jgi:hypothetical protein
LLLAVWGSLNLVLVKVDLFTLYVALELLTFAAVPLVCLDCASRLVRRDAGAGELGLHAVARRSRRGGRFVRQHRRAATKGIEAPHCVLDGRAVRIPILDVSARLRPRYREARERRRFGRRHSSGALARHPNRPLSADIAHFESYLTRQGTIILKFFLHVSRAEQKKRFVQRLERPQKHWKFSSADIRERGFWADYMDAFEEAIRATATQHAPWFVVPADNKWFTRLVVAAAIVEAVEKLELSYPVIDAAKKKELAAARAALAREK